MNAPYDGDRAQGTGGDPTGQPPTPDPDHANAPGRPVQGEPWSSSQPADAYGPTPQQSPYGAAPQPDPYDPAGYPAQQQTPQPGPYQQPEPYAQPDAYQQPTAYQQPDAYQQPEPHQQPDAYQQPAAYQQPSTYQQPAAYQQPDPYLQGAYTQDPYQQPDPLTDALYDRAAHPPPPPGSQPPAQPLYMPPPTPQHAPDPRLYASPPAPEPDGPGRYLPYGDASEQSRYLGVDDLMTEAAEPQPQPDAFAHLYRDQDSTPQQPPRPEQPAAVPPQRKGGKVSSLAKSSAVMAAGTLVSRLTGFLRQLLLVAALGTAVLGDTYNVAFTLPTMIYILTIGGGLNSVFVPQLVRAMKSDEDGGEAYANRLLTLVAVVLGGLVLVSVLAAPLLVRLMSVSIADNAEANSVAVAFARYCLPTIFFMGIHVVMGQILNARGSFGPMMWTPVLNNIVVIGTFALFLWVYGTSSSSGLTTATIPDEGIRLLGIGTLLGLVVQALAMIPYLSASGFRVRPRFDWKGQGLGKAARLAKWTVFFVLANQAGMLVVTQLATWAGSNAAADGHEGSGILAYQSALLIWQMPQAIITVSVMAALLPRISRAAADGEPLAVRDDISHGLRTSAVAIVPLSFGFLALGIPMSLLLFGSSGTDGARSIGLVLMAFGLGLIPFSVQYVVLRGFYAYEDTRTPFYNTLVVAGVNAALSALSFLVLPDRYAVVGMAASYGVAYAVGVGVAWRRLKTRTGDLDGNRVLRTYTRLSLASLPATLVSGLIALGLLQALGNGFFGALCALLLGGAALLGLFYVTARRLRIEELNSLVGMVRGRLGR
ncbi:murein biosynthesis integral membrane protein MurJ [Streptomyces sp. NPDC051940]|uniref:murein biosynthesis integral membrane protein MurJ n=1 Tax=Streptomyces sp. NPDC051940 TaxID=3155675 RepID=UPI0034138812